MMGIINITVYHYSSSHCLFRSVVYLIFQAEVYRTRFESRPYQR